MRCFYRQGNLCTLMIHYRCSQCGKILDSAPMVKEHFTDTGHKFIVTIDIVTAETGLL